MLARFYWWLSLGKGLNPNLVEITLVYSKHDYRKVYWPDELTQTKGEVERWWENQQPPFIPVRAYYFNKREIASAFIYNPADPSATYHPYPQWFWRPGTTNLRNNALDKFNGMIGEKSSWGTNLAEAHQAVGMLEGRAMQILAAAKQIRRYNFGAAARILDLNHIPKGLRTNAKAFANNFLEYHFGWEPAIADIHNSLTTMTDADFGTRRIRANHSEHIWGRGPVTDGWEQYSWNIMCKLGAYVRITNESAYLANQSGLLNPLVVAWDMVPFSFVVDWFTNVGQVLEGVTGFVGLSIERAYTVTVENGNYQTQTNRLSDGFAQGRSEKNVLISRVPGLPSASLALKPFKGFSPIRGLTAISLLLQGLK